MPGLMRTRILFITGTDTGVGKTFLTSLLLCYLRAQGTSVLGLKPFCSGTRDDAELLHRLQEGALHLDEVNPFYFPEPVAPLISERKHHRHIPLDHVLRHVNSIAARLSDPDPLARPARRRFANNPKLKAQKYLLIEGSGGLLVPLGPGYTVRDVIMHISCDVLVVGRNKLGTINHTLLTLNGLGVRIDGSKACVRQRQSARVRGVVLMDQPSPDPSSRTNAAILEELIAPIPLVRLPYFGRHCTSRSRLQRLATRLHIHKVLAPLL